jgi:hypothetical protein
MGIVPDGPSYRTQPNTWHPFTFLTLEYLCDHFFLRLVNPVPRLSFWSVALCTSGYLGCWLFAEKNGSAEHSRRDEKVGRRVENDEKDGIDEVCTMYVWVEEEKGNTQGTARHSKARRLRQKQDELVMRITIIIIIIIIISFKAVLVNVASIRW